MFFSPGRAHPSLKFAKTGLWQAAKNGSTAKGLFFAKIGGCAFYTRPAKRAPPLLLK